MTDAKTQSQADANGQLTAEDRAKAIFFTPDYELSEFEKDWEWEVKFSDVVRAIEDAVAAERERCALIAENATFAMSPGPLYSAGFVAARKFITDSIRVPVLNEA
jgi:hypothetical protein